MGRVLADMRWTDVGDLLARGATAVLPIGAAAKEHGPHLPMQTDYLTAEALGARLAARANVLVWPTVGYGHYPAFRDYPGSTSLPEEVFQDVVQALLEDLARHGPSAILVLNTGISTIRGVDGALEFVNIARAQHVYRGERYLAAAAEICERGGDGHADEAETSVMLHLFREHVDMDKAPTWTQPIAPGRWTPTDSTSPSYSPHGIAGDATLATAQKGERLVSAMLDDLLAAL